MEEKGRVLDSVCVQAYIETTRHLFPAKLLLLFSGPSVCISHPASMQHILLQVIHQSVISSILPSIYCIIPSFARTFITFSAIHPSIHPAIHPSTYPHFHPSIHSCDDFLSFFSSLSVCSFSFLAFTHSFIPSRPSKSYPIQFRPSSASYCPLLFTQTPCGGRLRRGDPESSGR